MESANTVKTEIVEIGSVMASPKNPRKIDETALYELQNQIVKDPTFLLSRPILVNRVNGRMVVYAGTQRFIACKELGLKKIPVRVVDNLDKDVVDHRMLLDNVNRGEFDQEMLAQEFSEELQSIIKAADFKNMKFRTVNKDKSKMIYLKLTFQMRDDLNLFYNLLDDLQERYPNETVSERLRIFLSTMDAVE